MTRAFVVGGLASHVYGTIAKRLLAHDISIEEHREMEVLQREVAIPKGAEVVIAFTDMTARGHTVVPALRKAAERAGIKFVATSRKYATMVSALTAAGFPLQRAVPSDAREDADAHEEVDATPPAQKSVADEVVELAATLTWEEQVRLLRTLVGNMRREGLVVLRLEPTAPDAVMLPPTVDGQLRVAARKLTIRRERLVVEESDDSTDV